MFLILTESPIANDSSIAKDIFIASKTSFELTAQGLFPTISSTNENIKSPLLTPGYGSTFNSGLVKGSLLKKYALPRGP